MNETHQMETSWLSGKCVISDSHRAVSLNCLLQSEVLHDFIRYFQLRGGRFFETNGKNFLLRNHEVIINNNI
jgi:hypothetical protein